MEVIQVETKGGFKCEISKDVFDDWELLEAFREIDKGDASAIVDVAPKLLGDKQYQKLKEFARDKSGKLRSSKMIEIVNEIMLSIKESKNS